MCELLGVSASKPVRVTYSLHEFAEHGGRLHPNKAGWGIAFYEGRDALLIKEPEPAADSPWVRFIETQPLTSTMVMAHVRHATVGRPSLMNTHPFRRELGGRVHLFAHNGSLHGIERHLPLRTGRYRPVGETDSEHAFCALLERLATLWGSSGELPSLDARLGVVAALAAELRELGTANFLFSDGDVLFAHAHERNWDLGGGRLSEARPPGLSIASHRDLSTRGLEVSPAGRDGHDVLYVASVPLTEHGWTPLPEGTLLALRRGKEVARVAQ